jgi:hypothetical protein
MQGRHHLAWCTVILGKTVKAHDIDKILDGIVFDSSIRL